MRTENHETSKVNNLSLNFKRLNTAHKQIVGTGGTSVLISSDILSLKKKTRGMPNSQRYPLNLYLIYNVCLVRKVFNSNANENYEFPVEKQLTYFYHFSADTRVTGSVVNWKCNFVFLFILGVPGERSILVLFTE